MRQVTVQDIATCLTTRLAYKGIPDMQTLIFFKDKINDWTVIEEEDMDDEEYYGHFLPLAINYFTEAEYAKYRDPAPDPSTYSSITADPYPGVELIQRASR